MKGIRRDDELQSIVLSVTRAESLLPEMVLYTLIRNRVTIPEIDRLCKINVRFRVLRDSTEFWEKAYIARFLARSPHMLDYELAPYYATPEMEAWRAETAVFPNPFARILSLVYAEELAEEGGGELHALASIGVVRMSYGLEGEPDFFNDWMDDRPVLRLGMYTGDAQQIALIRNYLQSMLQNFRFPGELLIQKLGSVYTLEYSSWHQRHYFLYALLVSGWSFTQVAPVGVCVACGVKGQVQQCSGCHDATYCNSQCQRRHWSQHIVDCLE